jgi:hypothetical protein
MVLMGKLNTNSFWTKFIFVILFISAFSLNLFALDFSKNYNPKRVKFLCGGIVASLAVLGYQMFDKPEPAKSKPIDRISSKTSRGNFSENANKEPAKIASNKAQSAGEFRTASPSRETPTTFVSRTGVSLLPEDFGRLTPEFLKKAENDPEALDKLVGTLSRWLQVTNTMSYKLTQGEKIDYSQLISVLPDLLDGISALDNSNFNPSPETLSQFLKQLQSKDLDDPLLNTFKDIQKDSQARWVSELPKAASAQMLNLMTALYTKIPQNENSQVDSINQVVAAGAIRGAALRDLWTTTFQMTGKFDWSGLVHSTVEKADETGTRSRVEFRIGGNIYPFQEFSTKGYRWISPVGGGWSGGSGSSSSQ